MYCQNWSVSLCAERGEDFTFLSLLYFRTNSEICSFVCQVLWAVPFSQQTTAVFNTANLCPKIIVRASLHKTCRIIWLLIILCSSCWVWKSRQHFSILPLNSLCPNHRILAPQFTYHKASERLSMKEELLFLLPSIPLWRILIWLPNLCTVGERMIGL